MPGISLLLSENLQISEKQINKILSEQNYLEGYTNNTLLVEKNLFVGCNIYQNYPIKVFNKDNYFVVIEGKIYNKNEMYYEDEIIELAKNFEDVDNDNELSKWLQNSDGDFIVFIYNSLTKNFYVFNDIFGRLPLYYKIINGGIVVSRYLNFVNQISNKTDFDRISIAQFLMFGFMLNTRTMYENVHHLRPASLLMQHNNEIQVKNIFKFNFQNRKYSERDSKENINNLTELFSTSCKSRFLNNKLNIVTLSGGLDSRLVASSVYKNNIPFSAVTFRHKNGSVIKDEQIAIQLSKLFNIEHKILEISPPSGSDVYTLLKLKEGMNSLFTSYLLPFYYQVKRLYGDDINFITGDNGDKLIFTLDKRPEKFSNLDELANYIYAEHSLLNAEVIENICGVNKNKIIDEIKILLNTFPEDDLWQKYVHFKIMERPHKFAFQGEDRHRHFFWTLSPFWSFPFYNYIMNCSDISKKKHKLYAGLIHNFSPEAIQLPYSNFKSSINSFKGKIALSLLYYIYPKIPKKIKIKFKVGILGWNPKVNKDSIIINCIKEQLLKSNKVSNFINIENVSSLEDIRKASLFNILTITSVIEKFYEENTSLNNYSDKEFN